MISFPALIFSDLDGTLLDHYSYSAAAANDMLAWLHANQIPVILNTSKTYIEVADIAAELNTQAPIIVENGAAVYFPSALASKFRLPNEQSSGDYIKVAFTQPHSHWLSVLASVDPKFKPLFTSFTELGIDGIIKHTGLSRDNAIKASQREFGEPLAWHGNDTEKQAFLAQLRALGAHPVEGGRFIHVCGNCSKGEALTWLSERYKHDIYNNKDVTTIALGDGNNDVSMLEVAHYAVRVRSPVHQPPTLERDDNTITTDACGPEGWSDALTSLFSLN